MHLKFVGERVGDDRLAGSSHQRRSKSVVDVFDRDEIVETYYMRAMGEVYSALRGMGPEHALGIDEETLVDELAHRWLLEPVMEDPQRPPESTGQVDRELIERPRGSFERKFGSSHAEIQYVSVKLFVVPSRYNRRSLEVRGNNWPSQFSYRANLTFDPADHSITIRVQPEYVQRELELTRQRLKILSADIEQFTGGFMASVWEAVRRRRAELASMQDTVHSALGAAGVRLVRKDDAVEPVNVQVKREVQILRNSPAQAATSIEPQLDHQSLEQVLALVEQAGQGFEVAPAVFGSLREEDLRMILLGYLNAVFARPAATGETFSVSGKADILLNVTGGAVLIVECHWWQGEATYIEKLEQLFGYLAFRQTAAVMVTFSDRVSMTDVVDAAHAAIQRHGSRQGTVSVPAATRCISTHEHPRDPKKRVEVHHLFFNLVRPKGAVRGSGTPRKRTGSRSPTKSATAAP